MLAAFLLGVATVSFRFLPWDYYITYIKDHLDPDSIGYMDVAGPYKIFSPDDLTKREPAEIQISLKRTFELLTGSSDADLFVLKSSDDPCLLSDLIYCNRLPSAKVKPFIEAALAYKQQAQARELSNRSTEIAIGSLIVSFCGMLLSLWAFFFRKKSS